jgi:uncharacterized NAD(P)/FAD-binding protein YdhS/predicted metal-dependent enzyme (double-stranded beta helix superfamily)
MTSNSDTPVLSGPVAQLVRQLDDSGPDLTLIRIADVLSNSGVTLHDVMAYVRPTRRTYHRAAIVRREHYELLVLTWLPGQGSAPHDHAGSISAMMVLQGEAAEGCWRIAADGYAELQFETAIKTGRLTAWQDAGVHSVRNASVDGATLVTVHVYTPPLKDFRRFAPRPNSLAAETAFLGDGPRRVVVIGGGFSGTITAAQILGRADGAAVDVAIVERQGAVGEGLAYSTRDTSHLLNVPAGRMSAWPDRPHDFVEWVSRRYAIADPADFLPRQWYGEYMRESLLAAAREAADSSRLTVLFDEARRIIRRPDGGWIVNLARGPSLEADAVVLAIGHRPPTDAIGRLWSGPRTRYIADPWRPFATNAVRADEPVAILGSGLTAVDAVMSLNDERRRAPITLISRRGLLPQAHAARPAAAVDLQEMVSRWQAAPGGPRVKDLLHALRNKAREVAAAGGDWRSVIDGLRAHTAALWQSTSAAERCRFLSRLRPFWEAHRHRMAPAVAERFTALCDRGLVSVVAGRIASAQADHDDIRLYVRERDDRLREIHAAWVLNCTGPAASNSADANPAIGSLLVHGRVRQDDLGLGLETTADGRAVDASGDAAADLFIVGTLRKPALWESTAVPELRGQAAGVADCVLAQVRRLSATAV